MNNLPPNLGRDLRVRFRAQHLEQRILLLRRKILLVPTRARRQSLL